ncbi:MAG: dTDP-4-dehydrorhamnose 3,5-epimerase [bacterium]|nr:dTDP-4-dehydrorhamnose 3,5-epimerase [bacterium]
MIFTKTKLEGAYIIDIEKHEDERGIFARTFCVDGFKKHGLESKFVQANLSFNYKKGTLRGMHFQKSPYEEDKLVRCTKGSLFDVIIDLRRDSPTYKQWVGVELTEENRRALFIPKGFAHGYITLEDSTEINYMVTQVYTPDADTGVRYNDQLFAIEWPIEPVVISKKDANHPKFEETK